MLNQTFEPIDQHEVMVLEFITAVHSSFNLAPLMRSVATELELKGFVRRQEDKWLATETGRRVLNSGRAVV